MMRLVALFSWLHACCSLAEPPQLSSTRLPLSGNHHSAVAPSLARELRDGGLEVQSASALASHHCKNVKPTMWCEKRVKYCSSNETYVARRCRKTCGACRASPYVASVSPASVPSDIPSTVAQLSTIAMHLSAIAINLSTIAAQFAALSGRSEAASHTSLFSESRSARHPREGSSMSAPPSAAPSVPFYRFSLKQTQLESGISSTGDPGKLIRRLEQGLPIAVAVLGASVAQQGGCLDQSAAECMAFRKRGCFSLFFAWINKTWPNPNHTLQNFAHSAESVHSMLPCLLSSIPSPIHLVIIEASSMAENWVFSGKKRRALEKVIRVLMSLQDPPVALFLNVPLWTSVNIEESKSSCGAQWFMHRGSSQNPGQLLHEMHTPTATAANYTRLLCRHYGLACLSYYDAISIEYHAQLPGFSVRDIAADCLHPAKGKHGSKYLADMLVFWLLLGTRHCDTPYGCAVDKVSNRSVGEWAVPLSPHEDPNIVSGSCFRFDAEGQNHQRMRTIPRGKKTVSTLPWRSMQCTQKGCAEKVSPCPFDNGLKVNNDPLNSRAAETLATHSLQESGWTFCTHTGGSKNRVEPGLWAFKPGAQLHLEVPLIQKNLHQKFPNTFVMSLKYLSSYEHMGQIRLSCSRDCACSTVLIDAHRVSRVRNTSIVREYPINVTLATTGQSPFHVSAVCLLILTTLNQTSSGEHRFKVVALNIV